MSITPYTPASFATPVANPAVGGTGTPYAYVSNSEYRYAPTSVDTENLVINGTQGDQDMSLANTLLRASAWADRIVFGADPAAKGASLCATLSIETAQVPLLRGELRLVCDYKPIIQVNGVDVGPTMSTLTSVGSSIAQMIRIGRRTIYVPMYGYAARNNNVGTVSPTGGGKYLAVWSYVNGYPHSQLVGTATLGTKTINLQPTDGGAGLLGIIPGQTQMTIVDGVQTERFTVESVTNTTITSTTPFQYTHIAPASPDFIPVTTLPADVPLAVIFLANALIKTQGDSALILQGLREPEEQDRDKNPSGGLSKDIEIAKDLLKPYTVRIKTKT